MSPADIAAQVAAALLDFDRALNRGDADAQNDVVIKTLPVCNGKLSKLHLLGLTLVAGIETLL